MFYVFFLGKITQGIFYVVFPILAKLEMDQLVEKNEKLFWIIQTDAITTFFLILLIIFLFKLLEDFLKSFIQLFEYDYINIYDNYYLEALYKRVSHIEPGIFLNSRNKRFIWEILWNASQIWNWIRQFVGDLIWHFFTIIWIIAVLALTNFWIFIVLAWSSLCIYFIEKAKKKYEERGSFQQQYDFSDKIWILTEQIQKNPSYLMASWGFPIILQHLSRYNEELRKNIKNIQKRNMNLNLISFGIENIGEISVKIIVGYSIFMSGASVGTMTLALLYVGKMNDVFNFLRYLKFYIDDFKDQLLKLDLFLDISSPKKEKTIYLSEFQKIQFDNVGFSYPNFAKEELRYLEIIENRIKSYSSLDEYRKNELHLIEESRKEVKVKNPQILENISLDFQIWKSYGLVGKNGAWKTSLASLLLNYFDSYTGSIKIDNCELRDCKRDFFIDSISIVHQVPYIIDGLTIKENLLLWVQKKYSDTKIWELLDKFWLKKKIMKNRLWLESRIWYENDFSGWEKQIISLIRVLLQDKKILIMDEWTNQLDAENEIFVMSELFKNKKDKIVIFITHRMSTIRKSDIIYCLEDGKIQNFWNHEKLMQGDNVYKSFWKKQIED